MASICVHKICRRFTLGTLQVNFILQEAHEKANEIFVKTEHDFKYAAYL